MRTTLCSALCLTVIGAGALFAQPFYFTRIANGPIATDSESSMGCALADYDNDGWVDVFAATDYGGTNCLYHNNGNFLFSKVSTEPMWRTLGDWGMGVFADYDNDGDPDLFLSKFDPGKSHFFRNDPGTGSSRVFTPITNGVNIAAASLGAAWGDYDNDGFVDLAVANSGPSAQSEFLYRNDGAGRMVPITAPPLTSSGGRSQHCAWADYDGDGDLDIFVANAFYQTNFLFRNEGGGTFTRVNEGEIVTASGYWIGPAWGDYDNDGDLDLFVSQWDNRSDALYRNDGGGTFTPIANDPVVTSGGMSTGAAWGDFDNDGYLDLFVANNYYQADFLYHNERDGTFTRIYDGDIVNNTAGGFGAACADLDNDGFLDLFVSNNGTFNPIVGEPNLLYRNDAKTNGNNNGWLLVRLIGIASNGSAIGAKIRATATQWGKELWQMREISSGGNWGQSDLRSHFGLGDAAQVDLLRIEWPSGIVQTLTNVAPNQILTITEHQADATSSPSLTVTKPAAGPLQLTATGQTNLRYVFEASTNLAQWTKIAVRTNLFGTVDYTTAASSAPAKFYRVVVP